MKRTEEAKPIRTIAFAFFILICLSGLLYSENGPNTDYFVPAIAIPIFAIAIAYMASYLFNIQHLRGVLNDELFQVIMTAAIALTLVSTQLFIDSYLIKVLKIADAEGQDMDEMMELAEAKLEFLKSKTANILKNMQDVANKIGLEASKGVFCNFMGVGFSVSNCSPWNAYRGSITLASMATIVALSDLYAQHYLLSLARQYSFTIFIPLGLLLRCFKISRSAGGALIAIGFGFYTIYPAIILANENLIHKNTSPPPSIPSPGECNPIEEDVQVSLSQFKSYGKNLTQFQRAKELVYFVLVRVLFLSILNIFATLSFIRAFAGFLGSDIDVYALARIS